jgi:hypothetical protein
LIQVVQSTKELQILNQNLLGETVFKNSFTGTNIEVLRLSAPQIGGPYPIRMNTEDGVQALQIYNLTSGNTPTDGITFDFDGTTLNIINHENSGNFTLTDVAGDTFTIENDNTRVNTTLDILSTRNRIEVNRAVDEEVGFYLTNSTAGLAGSMRIAATSGQLELFSGTAQGVLLNSNGGPTNISGDTSLQNGNLNISLIGKGLFVAQGADARMDSCTLTAGTCTITNATVQAAGSGAGTDSIYCTGQDDNGGTAGAVRVSARTVGVDYTVTSTNVLDTSIVSCLLVGGL